MSWDDSVPSRSEERPAAYSAKARRAPADRSRGGGGPSAPLQYTFVGVAIVASGLLATAGVRTWQRASREVSSARDSLAVCRRRIVQIKSRMQRRPVLSSTASADFDYGAAVRRAALAAEIDRASFPEPSLGAERTIASTPYIEQEVKADLGPVTLAQVIVFLHKLSTGAPSFRVREIEMVPADRGHDSRKRELWEPRIVLTYTRVDADHVATE